MTPKVGFEMSRAGSARLVWLSTLVKVPSARRRTVSVMAKVLLRPVERLTVPGPMMEPTGALPKRPMGRGTGPEPEPVVQEVPGVQVGLPGQTKEALLIQLERLWLEGLAEPTWSAC